MSEPPVDAETFLAVTDSVAALQPGLSTLEAGILAALHLGLATDSRSFARVFGIEHALVLRAVETLASDAGLLALTERNARTQRTRYAVSAAGDAMMAHLHG
ncbi:Rha family transcriptional regulator [Methylobacterium flocculans]|uniref:Rha family transcriptional regulator n=1 Tax=Methylobacterium flocculans TaxID=2984843 RepID=UPI0021F37D7C|nr:Rha family transcriptional regulator [Methylobacterium sp. FF17]